MKKSWISNLQSWLTAFKDSLLTQKYTIKMAVITVHGLHYIKLVSAETFFVLLISLSCISALDEPQAFSVREPGSIDVTGYTCNSYIKQFSSVDQVTFNFMGVVGEPCLCSLNVSPSVSLSDEDIVLSILFQSFTRSVEYKLFKECSEDLTFQVVSQSTTQINIIVRCGNDYRVNDVSTENPIVMTKPEEFSASISMQCQSENEITTAQPLTNKPITEEPGAETPVPNLPDDQANVGDDSEDTGGGGSSGKTAGIVIGVLLAIGCVVGVAVFLVWRWKKKQPQPDRPPMTHDPPISTVANPNTYDNKMYTNTENNNTKTSNTSLNESLVGYADIDPRSLKGLERPVRSPSMDGENPALNYVEIDWKKNSAV